MELLIKVCGFILIIGASCLIGFYNSYKLKIRSRKLMQIYSSLSEMKERIRLNSGEIEKIINISFDKNILYSDKGKIIINNQWLKSQDIILINEYFKNIGMSDTKSECERAELYMTLILKQQNEAQKKCSELCKLYNTLGFLFGIFLCIFFL